MRFAFAFFAGSLRVSTIAVMASAFQLWCQQR